MIHAKNLTRRQRGFTLIELLVVMAIIGILIGLLVPAVQKARESAARLQCTNNLKNIGLAILHYEEVYKFLPPSRDLHSYPGELGELLGPNNEEPDGDETSTATWAVYILPYLDQDNLFNGFKLTPFTPLPAGPPYAYAYNDQTPQVVQTAVPVYFCPTRRRPDSAPVLSDPAGNGGLAGALGDYACCIGTTGDDVWNANLSPLNPNGAFQLGVGGQGVRIAQITDGLSNTLFIGEKHVPQGSFGEYPWDCCIYDGDTFGGVLSYHCAERAAGLNYPFAASVLDQGWKFGSYHPGLCQFVFGDGSVHALSVAMDPQIMDRLANIGDGLPVPAIE